MVIPAIAVDTLPCMYSTYSMPVQYVIEEWDFRDLVLQMKPPVLIPRPETEVFPPSLSLSLSLSTKHTNTQTQKIKKT